MRTVISVLFALFLISLPLTAVAAEGPMKLPAGSNAGADMHNKAGIKNWNAGNIEGALKHFQEASAEDGTIAETHFNEAVICASCQQVCKLFCNGKPGNTGFPFIYF